MKRKNPKTFRLPSARAIASAVLLLCLSAAAWSVDDLFLGPALSLGPTSTERGYLIDANPAAYYAGENGGNRLSVDGGLRLEYGNVDDLFKLIDDLSNSINGPDGGGGGGGSGGGAPGPPIDPIDPDLEEVINAIVKEAERIAPLIAWVAFEGYAKSETALGVDIQVGKPVLGGQLRVAVSTVELAGAVGIADEINFDGDEALDQLEKAWNLTPDSPKTTFDLTGGVYLTVDPPTGNVSFTFENDSLLLTKSTRETTFALDYAAPIHVTDATTVTLGVRPKFIQVGSSNVATRLGDIRDAESLFKQIDDARLQYEEDFAMDMGLRLTGQQYQLGITVRNAVKPSFRFPGLDYSRYTSAEVVRQVESSRRYDPNRQVSVDGALVSASGRWLLQGAVDLDTNIDPLQLPYQWFTLGASYSGTHWYSSNFRAGLRKNLAGTGLGYASMGYTLAGFWNFDLGLGLESVTLQGQKLPKSLAVSTGFQRRF